MPANALQHSNYSNTCQIESIKTEVIDPDLNLVITRRDRCVGREPSSGPNFEEMGVGSGFGVRGVRGSGFGGVGGYRVTLLRRISIRNQDEEGFRQKRLDMMNGSI